LMLDDMLIVDVGVTAALNKDSGEEIWHSKKFAAGYSSPVVFTQADRKLLASFYASGLVIIDPANGSTVSSLPWQTKFDVNAADPIIVGDMAFITSGYGHGCALVNLAGDKVKIMWQNNALRSHFTTPVLHEGTLYGVDDNVGSGKLVCMDFKTGNVNWVGPKVAMASLILAGERLLILTQAGELILAEASPSEYKELARAKVMGPTCWTISVLAGGKVYCRNDKGSVVCVAVGN